jgi:hypothetical protein
LIELFKLLSDDSLLSLIKVESVESVLKTIERVFISIFSILTLISIGRSIRVLSLHILAIDRVELSHALLRRKVRLDLHCFVQTSREHRSLLVDLHFLDLTQLFVVEHKVKKSEVPKVPILCIVNYLLQLNSREHAFLHSSVQSLLERLILCFKRLLEVIYSLDTLYLISISINAKELIENFKQVSSLLIIEQEIFLCKYQVVDLEIRDDPELIVIKFL